MLGGSTQWALDNAEQMRSNAVTYINVDTGVQGRDFIGGATPALAWLPARRQRNRCRIRRRASRCTMSGLRASKIACRRSRPSSAPRTTRRSRNTSAFRASTCTSTVRTASITRSTTTTSGRAPWSIWASATASRCRSCGASWRGDSPTPTSCRCVIRITRARPSATSRPPRRMQAATSRCDWTPHAPQHGAGKTRRRSSRRASTRPR